MIDKRQSCNLCILKVFCERIKNKHKEIALNVVDLSFSSNVESFNKKSFG